MADHPKGNQYYVIFSSPAAPREEINKVLPDHLKRQVDLEKDGTLFGAGPLFDEGADSPTVGMIIVRAESFEEADKIAAGDPLHAAGLRTYTIQRWSLNEGSFTTTIHYSDRTSTTL